MSSLCPIYIPDFLSRVCYFRRAMFYGQYKLSEKCHIKDESSPTFRTSFGHLSWASVFFEPRIIYIKLHITSVAFHSRKYRKTSSVKRIIDRSAIFHGNSIDNQRQRIVALTTKSYPRLSEGSICKCVCVCVNVCVSDHYYSYLCNYNRYYYYYYSSRL